MLEIGTLAAYSTIWLARALPPGGRLVTLEANPRHADVAQANIRRAGLAHLVDLRLGPALDTLATLEQQGAGPFDLVFIDADKANSADYLAWALTLSRVGTVIVADNAVRGGRVADSATDDVNVEGARRFIDLLSKEPRVSATALQTVGTKGYDGFELGVVVR